MILSTKRITKAAFVVCKPPKTGFLESKPIYDTETFQKVQYVQEMPQSQTADEWHDEEEI